MDVGDFFELDSVELNIDGNNVSNHLYTTTEVDALNRGGVHKLYVRNLLPGEHEVVAIFTGKGPQQRDYRRGAALRLEKGTGEKYLELKIADSELARQPEFIVSEWD